MKPAGCCAGGGGAGLCHGPCGTFHVSTSAWALLHFGTKVYKKTFDFFFLIKKIFLNVILGRERDRA